MTAPGNALNQRVSLEIPLQAVAPELIDPAYENRHELTDIAPSLPVMNLGRLTDLDSFSGRFDQGGRGAEWLPTGHDIDELHIDYGDAAVRYEFPSHLAQFSEAIGLIAAHEHGAYPDAIYERVTIEAQQSQVARHKTQRGSEVHRDGGRGAWQHVYLVSDQYPTEFFVSEKLTSDWRTYTRLLLRSTVSAEPYEVVYANRTTFHRSPRVPEDCVRTFLRATYVHDLAASTR